MPAPTHKKVTGFSGNEIYCLRQLGCDAGQLCLGNNVIALGVARGLGAGLSSLAGGEVEEVTKLVHQGREQALERMLKEAQAYGGIGLAGVSFDMINHAGNLEFVALGSTIHTLKEGDPETLGFTAAADGQELYCQIDAGFDPKSFVFGNVAYSIGVGGNLKGAFRGLKRGEVTEYTEIFDRTRHLALSRIKEQAKRAGANAVVGIQTTVMPLMGTQEMMMTGTAAVHPALAAYANDPVTCEMTNEELWNMANLGYLPVGMVMGVSVYSLGLVGGIGASLRSLAGGKLEGLSEILYEAREKAFERIQRDAQNYQADKVVGVKTRVYDLGGGLVELMVIGTAVRQMPKVTTRHNALPPQAIIQDRDTFVDTTMGSETRLSSTNAASAPSMQAGPLGTIIWVVIGLGWLLFTLLGHG